MTLGVLLKSARTRQGKTLRQVEALSGISNGYLSQLESDAIQQPSPRHLEKLAQIYEVSYASLMESAGYAVPVVATADGTSASAIASRSRSVRRVARSGAVGSYVPFPGLDELTDEDRRKIQAYIDDLKAARRARPTE